MVGAFGIVVERLIIRHLYGRLADTMLATWGLSLIMVQAVENRYGSVTEGISVPVGNFTVGEFSMSKYNFVLIAAAAVGVLATYTIMRRTRYGLLARAATQSSTMAEGLGVNTSGVNMWTFGLGSALAGAAGALLAPVVGVIPTMGQTFVARAFMTVIVGGPSFVAGTVSASGLLGFIENVGHQLVHPGHRPGHAAHGRDRDSAVPASRAHRDPVPAMRDLLARVAGSGAKPAGGSVRRDLGGAALAFAAAAVLGNWVEEFTAFEWSLWAVQAILALSLTLVWGYGGIFSLGQAAIYGIGGYTYGFWAINLADNTGESLTAVLAAVLVGAVFAALLGYFMFYGNVTDVYVAIITLATSLVLFAFVNSTSGRAYRIGDAPFGGYNGMPRIPRITWRLPGGESHELTRTQFFLFCVAAGLVIAVAIRVLSRRPFGRIAVALQHNELRTGLLGYDVRWHKLAVFTIGGAIAAFAGALFAAWGRFMSPPVFSLTPAALVVIWVLVGGRSSVSGAFVGVLVVKGFSSWFGGAAATTNRSCWE